MCVLGVDVPVGTHAVIYSTNMSAYSVPAPLQELKLKAVNKIEVPALRDFTFS